MYIHFITLVIHFISRQANNFIFLTTFSINDKVLAYRRPHRKKWSIRDLIGILIKAIAEGNELLDFVKDKSIFFICFTIVTVRQGF